MNDMKKCCFIIPYFGRFNNYFPLFLKSCGYNNDFNWLIITDDTTKYDYPQNFEVLNMSFTELKELIQSKFDFKIALNSPYKLCDYKPAYGYIFEEYIKDYQYWGHCDVDTIMGNLSNFLTNTLLEKYDKLFCQGHMTIYRNTFENNRVFMSVYKGISLYKKVFSKNDICWFDEEWKDEYNINEIFLSRHKNVYSKDLSFNIYIPKIKFIRTMYVGKENENDGHGYKNESFKNALYLWNHGSLYRLVKKGNEILKEEYLYMHFQSRSMRFSKLLNLQQNIIKIIPNCFMPLEVDSVTKENFDKIKKSFFFTYIDVKIIAKFRRFLERNKRNVFR